MNNLNFEALDANNLSFFNLLSPYPDIVPFNDELASNQFSIGMSELDIIFPSQM